MRLRVRRFLDDWRRARNEGWPVLRFEDFVAEPEGTLWEACRALELDYDPAMVEWPYPEVDAGHENLGSLSFQQSRGANLRETLRDSAAELRTDGIPRADLEWLEAECADFNAAHGYPAEAPGAAEGGRLEPRFENAARYRRNRAKEWAKRQVFGSRWGRELWSRYVMVRKS